MLAGQYLTNDVGSSTEKCRDITSHLSKWFLVVVYGSYGKEANVRRKKDSCLLNDLIDDVIPGQMTFKHTGVIASFQSSEISAKSLFQC